MAIELEAKVEVKDFTDVRRRLRANRGRQIGTRTERNHFFDDKSGTLRHNDCGLRLRESRAVGTRRPDFMLTYKGARQPGRLKRREEIELCITDAPAMELLLDRLGLSRRFTFKKRRESWMLRKCRVELDEVAELGRFVEVEGPDEKTINAALKTLGLDECTPIRQSYPQLLAARRP